MELEVRTRQREVSSLREELRVAVEREARGERDAIGAHAPLGSRVSVWWPSKKHFYTGTVGDSMDALGRVKVSYDDGWELHDMRKENWKLVQPLGDA